MNQDFKSTFIEIINPKRANVIVGVVYMHPSMADVNYFNDVHLRPFIFKIALENKKNIHIAGDLNINLLQVTSHHASSEFFDILTSNHILPTISLPTKLNSSGNHTLIDNIFTNVFNPDIISGNSLFNPSDGHLPSFVIIPKPNQNHLPKKHNYYKRNTKKFNPNDEDFPIQICLMSQDLKDLDWENILQNDKFDANVAFNNFFATVEPIIDKYMPLEKVKNKDHKRRYKPWITKGLLVSMRRRDKILQKIIKSKDQIRKQALRIEFNNLRNRIVELIMQSKQKYFNSYFSTNNSNMRKIWQGIKNLINIKSKTNDSPTCISDNGSIITDPTKISNSFNTYFSNIAENILKGNKYNGDGNYKKFLPQINIKNITIDPVDCEEICSIINTFNTKKGTGPSSIPTIFLYYMQK